MRMLSLPAALAMGAILYAYLPAARGWLDAGLGALLAKAHQLFTTKRGRTDSKSALAVFLLALAAAATLIGALHPIAAAVVLTPVFTGFSVLPRCSAIKAELSSGKYAKDIPEYERLVVETCAPVGGAFAQEVAAPMLLCALGMPLHLGCALSWVYVGLRAVKDRVPAAARITAPVERAGDALLVALLLLCAGLVGRNPLNVGGHGAGQKLMHILGLEGEMDHAPIAGDITQGMFLCCLCAWLLCFVLTLAGILFI